jgi:hypothetical protein
MNTPHFPSTDETSPHRVISHIQRQIPPQALDSEIPKYLVLPQSRESALRRKLRSPLFANYFRMNSWQPIFFEKVRENFHKSKTIEPEKIANKLSKRTVNKSSPECKQLKFFD